MAKVGNNLHKSAYDIDIADALNVSLDNFYKVLREFENTDYQMIYFEMGQYFAKKEPEMIDKYKKIFQKYLREEKLNRINE